MPTMIPVKPRPERVRDVPVTPVAEEAKALLRYSVVDTNLAEKRNAVLDEKTLLALLREQGLRYYRTKDVERYKVEQVTKAQRRNYAAQAVNIASLGRLVGGTVSAHWDAEQLSQYDEEIPCEALERAVLLRKASENVSFSIETLMVSKTPLARAAPRYAPRPTHFDPLLFAHYGSAKLCIAVWDEPGFYAPLNT